jgi:pimeloyl-ACP methyl ester carboxylesterase
MHGVTDRTVRTNGIDMHVVEAGKGPLVVLCHGFPELAYSWRHQVPALANAGCHVVAPDMRGYGDTSRPVDVADYDILHLGDDILGLIDALGEEQAVLVGHDWGALVVWHLAQRAPERVSGVVAMSVAFRPRTPRPPTEMMKRRFADTWFYILYFQEPGVADADLARDPATTMRRFLTAISGDAPAGSMSALAGERDGRGMVERMPEPDRLPDWLIPEELDRYSETFARTGFTGGINWYRNFDRNWELTADLAETRVQVPALFMAGAKDPVLVTAPPDAMADWVLDLRGTLLVPGAGHWIQQERPHEVNAAMIGFLDGLRLAALR